MAHDVLRLSIRSDHLDEIAVYMEDGRNPDGSEAGNAGSRTWPCSCRASPSLVSPLGLASFGAQPITFWHVVSTVALGQGVAPLSSSVIQPLTTWSSLGRHGYTKVAQMIWT